MTVPDGLCGEEALALARRTLMELDAAAQRCADTFGDNVRVANHPILGGFTVHQWRRFHWVHTRHHARQIRPAPALSTVQRCLRRRMVQTASASVTRDDAPGPGTVTSSVAPTVSPS